MRRLLLNALVFCVAIVALVSAQSPTRSYLVYVHVLHMDVARNDGVDTCLISDDNGQFRYEQSTSPQATAIGGSSGMGVSRGRVMGSRGGSVLFGEVKPKVYLGQLEEKKLEELKSLVNAPELADLGPSPAPSNMVVARGYDMVSLRIHRDKGTQELEYILVDGRGAMPKSVRAFIPWMDGLKKAIGHADHHAEARDCSGLDAGDEFQPQLQKREPR